MPIRHAFNSPMSDGGDPNLLQPSNWNDHHVGGDRLWAPGSDPYGLDDEFDDETLSGWTRVDAAGTAGHLTWTETADAVSAAHLSGTDGDKYLHVLLKSIGAHSHPLTIQTAVRFWSLYGANYQMLGLLFADGNTHGAGKQIVYMPFMSGPMISLRPYINFSVDNQSPGNLNSGTQPSYGHAMHLKLVWSAANTFDMYTSPNGVDWLNHGQRVYSMTPTHIGILYSNWGTSTPGVGTYEYFRVY